MKGYAVPTSHLARCAYCGKPTAVRPNEKNTPVARFPHHPFRQKWPPICYEIKRKTWIHIKRPRDRSPVAQTQI